ncbi:MAG: recombination regulator RecX [Sutterellaceae bacterium]|nr:recombination regulator RecX [Sutterellaceae bacterium]MDD7442263.1 recombination regulator RecX [Sutterellaceae bacterium]MDY2867385.1 recombination regulator RecX [Mesosutterella sp.]
MEDDSREEHRTPARRRAGNQTLLQKSVSLLSRREYSRRELGEKLRRAGTGEPPEKIEAVLDALEAKGYLSDKRFAEQLVRAKASRYGRKRLEFELRQRGLRPDEISEALAGLEETEESRARAVWERRFSEAPSDQKERARQFRFLLSRGFSYSAAARVIGDAERNG